MKIRVLLDLDDVLADFQGAVARAFGYSLEQVNANRPAGTEWEISPALARLLGHELTLQEFWARVYQSADISPCPVRGAVKDIFTETMFWSNLPPQPWLLDLIRDVNKVTTDWHVVTHPQDEEGCYVGKRRWIKKHLGRDFSRYHLTEDKHLFANEWTVLIDDRDDNISNFTKAEPSPGKGIVFPRHWNRNHKVKDQALTFVRAALNLEAGNRSYTRMAKRVQETHEKLKETL